MDADFRGRNEQRPGDAIMACFQTRFVIARRGSRRGDPAGLLRRGATPLLAMTVLKTRLNFTGYHRLPDHRRVQRSGNSLARPFRSREPSTRTSGREFRFASAGLLTHERSI